MPSLDPCPPPRRPRGPWRRVGGAWTPAIRGCTPLLALLLPAACKGNPPVLLPVDDQVAVVGEQLVVQLVASDPEGDPVTFGFHADVPDLLTTTALQVTPAGQAIFTFTPLASQLGAQEFEFSASDEHHRSTQRAIIEVRGAVGVGSMPVFRRPLGAGTVLDLDQASCLNLAIEVDDPDSASIELSQAPPLVEGSQLVAEPDGRSGTWSWCPSRRQVEADDRYWLTLVADDGDNPPVHKEFVVVLRRRSGQDCPGQAPVIDHETQNFTTTLDLPIVAEISDDQGLGSTPYVVYALEDPGNPIDFSQTTLVEMDLRSGDMRQGTWQGSVPNPVVGEPEGTTVPLYYLVSATDDDDPEGDCDHRTDDPASGMHRINVTLGGNDSASLCDPCSFDVQCGDEDDLCLPGPGASGVCGQGCSDDAQCPSAYICSPQPVQSVEGAAARQCIPNAGHCGGMGGNCDDDDAEPNDDPTTALEQPVLPPGLLANRTLCQNDDDWYALVVAQPSRVQAQLDGDLPPDMDLALTQASGVLLESSDGLSSTESLTSDCLDPGTYLLRVHSVDSDPAGGYSLSLALDPAGCDEPMGGTGDCCADNGTPGCEDPAIEACVCALDAFCCNNEWDDICVGVATDSCDACGGGGSTGGGTNEDCCTVQDTPGCTDMDIQDCVCALDSFCCDVQWDAICVGRVGSDLCGPACMPDDADGPCCAANGTPGCEIDSVESCVCAMDPFCCDSEWDDMCVMAIGVQGCGTCPS